MVMYYIVTSSGSERRGLLLWQHVPRHNIQNTGNMDVARFNPRFLFWILSGSFAWSKI